MKYTEAVEKLKNGEVCLHMDVPGKDDLLSDILVDAFPEKERRTEFLPDRFFHGKAGLKRWLGRPFYNTDLPILKLSSITEKE